MNRFRAAVQFLTLFPIRLSQPIGLSRAAVFFPLVGGLLGAGAGGLRLFSQPFLGVSLASLVAIGSLLLMTGGIHEDGLADVADACRAGRTRETMLRIMKDSRIGVYGTLAVICSLLFRWEALTRCRINPLLGLAAALSLSRASLVFLAGISSPIGEGLGFSFIRHLSRTDVYVTITVGLIVAILCAHFHGAIMAGFSTFIVLGARSYFKKRIGGVNGDCLGATCQIVETVNLLILAWQPSI